MDVCAKLRRLLSERRIGHGGTLDPMATGVLPVFVGMATRAASLAENGDKEYIAGLRLGIVTNTQDSTGEILEKRAAALNREAVEAVLPSFTGALLQTPPMYSAIKINGQRLYALARSGREIERPPRPVTIYALELLEQAGPEEYLLRVRCSKGAYIRTLCHDIGAALGCGGCMSRLRRTMAAGFTLEEAVTLEEVAEKGAALLSSVDRMFTGCAAFTLTAPRQEQLCRNGSPVPVKGLAEGAQYRVYGMDGAFLCLSQYQEGRLVSRKNFFGASS